MSLSQTTHQSQKTRLAPPKKYGVFLLNDHYTPMDFVVEVLQDVFRLPNPVVQTHRQPETGTQTKKQTTQSELSALCDLVNLVKRDYAPWILAACLPLGPVVTSKETF